MSVFHPFSLNFSCLWERLAKKGQTTSEFFSGCTSSSAHLLHLEFHSW